jgi:undecaprenyl-diphosphatase
MDEILSKLERADIDLFLYMNSHHSEWLDFMMFCISYKWTWIPLYVFIIIILFKSFNRKHAILILVSIAILVTLADRISTGILKPYFKRHRPTHNIELRGQVHTVDGQLGGKYGFVSSHAANTFAVALFLSLVFRNRNSLWLFLWALLNCYSRIYLGVHFPLDIFFGSCLGIILAIGIYYLYKYSRQRLMPFDLDSA